MNTQLDFMKKTEFGRVRLLSWIILSAETQGITYFQAPRYNLRQDSTGQKNKIPSDTRIETGNMLY